MRKVKGLTYFVLFLYAARRQTNAYTFVAAAHLVCAHCDICSECTRGSQVDGVFSPTIPPIISFICCTTGGIRTRHQDMPAYTIYRIKTALNSAKFTRPPPR